MDGAAFIIASLGTVAVAAALWERKRYRLEMKWLHSVRAISEQPHANTDAFYSSLNAIRPMPDESLVLARLSAVRRLKSDRCPVILSDLSRVEEEAAETCWSHRIPRFFLAVFLVLGVGTTFLKLTDTLAKADLGGLLNSALSSDDAGVPGPRAGDAERRYATTIQKLTDGFQNAFQASIAAIASTAALLFVQTIFTAPAKARFFTTLDNFTQFSLLPRFAREEQPSREEMVLTVAQKMDATIENFEILSRQLKTTLSTSERTAESLDVFTGRFGEVVKSFSNAIGSNSQFHETIAKLYQSVSAAEGRHTTVLKRLEEGLDATAKQNDLLIENQQLLAQFQADVANSQASLLSSTTKLTEAAKEAVRSQQETLAQQNTELNSRLMATVNTLEVLMSKVLEATISAQERLTNNLDKSQQLLPEIRGLITRVQEGVAAARDTFVRYSEEGGRSLREISDLVAQGRKDAASAQEAASEGLRDSQNLLQRIIGLLQSVNAPLFRLDQTTQELVPAFPVVLQQLARLQELERVARSLEQSAQRMPGEIQQACEVVNSTISESSCLFRFKGRRDRGKQSCG